MFLCKGLHRMCGGQPQHDPCSLIRPAECDSMMLRGFAYNLQAEGHERQERGGGLLGEHLPAWQKLSRFSLRQH